MELLGGMLAFDPAQRLSARECLLRDELFGDADVVNGTCGAADSCATGRSIGSSFGVTKGYGSDETTGAVFDRVAGGVSGGSSGFNGSDTGDVFKAAVGGEGCDGTAETVSDLYDDESVVEMERGVVDGDEDDNNNDGDDYDDDEYEAADDSGGKIQPRASSVGVASAGREESRQSHAGKLQPGCQELEPPVPPPQETACLGEEGYVRKRVIEIEEKEEYFNSAGGSKNAPTGAGAGITAKDESPPSTGDEEPAATAAAAEGVKSDVGKINSSSCSSPREQTGDSTPAGSSGEGEEPSGSSVRSPVGVDKASPSYRAFDSTVAVAAAATTAIAADVAEDTLATALDCVWGAIQREMNTDCLSQGGLQERGGNEFDNSDDYTSNDEAQLKQTGPGAEVKTEGDITAGIIFGDEGYDSDSFGDGGEENNEGASTDFGGRTSFFSDLEPTTTAVDETSAAEASETGDVTDFTAATAPGTAGVVASQSMAPPTAGREDFAEKPLNSKPEGVEDNNVTQEDDGRTVVVTDEAAEKDEENNGDGWRVAGAFRVLAASGPGGELAVKAVKALLRRQGRRPPRLLSGEFNMERGAHVDQDIFSLI